MKVLMIGNSPLVHGGITSVINQIREYDWKKDGIELTFIPTYDGGNAIHKISYFIKAYLKIRGEIKCNKPDLVYMHMSHHGSIDRKMIVHSLCKKNNIPDIVHLHGSEFKKYYNEITAANQEKIRKFLREINALIVLGEKWGKIIEKIEPQTNTVVINNAVHIPDEIVEWDEPFKFLYLGVLVGRKGVLDLVEAVNRIRSESFKVIIGGVGNQEKLIKEKVKEYKLEDKFEFVGWVDGEKKEALLKSCQALILPSYNEGLPICILEAISYGMPVIATDVGDISAAVIDGKNGFLFAPGDVNEMSALMIKIINHSVWYYCADFSRKYAEEKFSYEKFVDLLRKCLVKACGGKT